jgi:hypothetical protein
MTLTVARDQIETFVNALFRYADEGGFVQMRAFRDDIDGVCRPERWRAEAINGSGLGHIVDAAAELASECAAAPEPVVFAGPVATFKIADRAAEKDLSNGLMLTVECDEAPEAARKKLETFCHWGELSRIRTTGRPGGRGSCFCPWSTLWSPHDAVREVKGSRSPRRRRGAKVSNGLSLTIVLAQASRRGPR